MFDACASRTGLYTPFEEITSACSSAMLLLRLPTAVHTHGANSDDLNESWGANGRVRRRADQDSGRRQQARLERRGRCQWTVEMGLQCWNGVCSNATRGLLGGGGQRQVRL
jgi:hypothetical protein